MQTTLLLVAMAWVLSTRRIHRIVPSESVAAFLGIGLVLGTLFVFREF